MVAWLLLAATTEAGNGGLRLNDVQVLGSHNSYRSFAPAAILAEMARTRGDAAQVFAYRHPPLAVQLDLGLRHLEIDTLADPAGGRFVDPPGESIAPGGLDREPMRRPGFKVLHIPGLDYRTHCAEFVGCLKQVKAWSDEHAGHLPIFIAVDSKDQPFNYRGATAPLPLTGPLLDALDAEIRSVFAPVRLITPDDVRGDHATLREAVLAGGWPRLDDARGKVLFMLLVRPPVANLYRAAHPSLRGRAMFSLYPADEAEAAVFSIPDPQVNLARIQELVRQGFIVRTRSDADTWEARRNDHRRWHAAVESGAQVIVTDYYPGAPDPERLNFVLSLPGGALRACNPLRQPAACHTGDPP